MGVALIILTGYLVSSRGIQKSTMCQFCSSSKEYPGRKRQEGIQLCGLDRDGEKAGFTAAGEDGTAGQVAGLHFFEIRESQKVFQCFLSQLVSRIKINGMNAGSSWGGTTRAGVTRWTPRQQLCQDWSEGMNGYSCAAGKHGGFP